MDRKMPKKISGEARVSYVGDKYAQLSKPNLNGKIFVVPSSVVGQKLGGYPPMSELLNPYDYVTFEAEPQPEKNGVKWCAVDGSVKRIRSAKTCTGTGMVTKMDETNGQYGFIQSTDGTSVFFNANVVRPETNDVMKAFNRNQVVRYKAVEQPNNKMTPWRAVMVCTKNYKEPRDSSRPIINNTNSSVRSGSATSGKTNTVAPTDNRQQQPTKYFDPFDSSHSKGSSSFEIGFTGMMPESPFGVLQPSACGNGVVVNNGDASLTPPRPGTPGSPSFRSYDQVLVSRALPPLQPVTSPANGWFDSLLPMPTNGAVGSLHHAANNHHNLPPPIDTLRSVTPPLFKQQQQQYHHNHHHHQQFGGDSSSTPSSAASLPTPTVGGCGINNGCYQLHSPVFNFDSPYSDIVGALGDMAQRLTLNNSSSSQPAWSNQLSPHLFNTTTATATNGIGTNSHYTPAGTWFNYNASNTNGAA